MYFNDSSTPAASLYHDALYLAGTDSNDLTAAIFARSYNRYHYLAALEAWRSSSTWTYDDTNNSGLPQDTSTTLVTGTNNYALPSTALAVDRVEVKDIAGNWSRVTAIDESQIGGSETEFMDTNGIPKYYRMVKNSIVLYPPPDTAQVTAAAGLKLYLKREVTEATASTTTTEPGLPEPFHRIMSVGAAYDYALAKGKDNANNLKQMLGELMAELRSFMAGRNTEMKARFRPASLNERYT